MVMLTFRHSGGKPGAFHSLTPGPIRPVATSARRGIFRPGPYVRALSSYI